MKLKLSSKKSREEKTTRKALEPNGKVTFNEHSSAVGSLTLASEGVTVQGGISDVKIPDTEIMIKKAGLEIFFGFKSKKNEEKPDEKSGKDKKDSKPTGESKPEVLGKDQDGEVAEKSLVKSSDKSSAKTPSEKKEKDHKTKRIKRGSRFGILGVVEINKVAIKVGLYTEQKKDKEKREWLAFGAIENVRKMSDDSKWVNPFNLNKNMVFSQLGFGTGFTYATVLVTGPDEIALRGQVDIGKFRAKLDMGLRVTSAETLFQLEMNKLDAMEIIQLAGVLIDNQAMQQMKGAEDKLVFKDLKLYVSSGAEFFGRYYDRGIQVQGKMWCFGKKGEFDGRFDENGVVIKAGIDNFKVGGLEITSTREGVDRATMDIEMTKDRQKLFIDGRIRYYSLEISVFLDLDIQEQYLKVDIKIKLTESLLLSLKADVVVKNHNSLEGAEMNFEAILETDILGVILQGITNGIDALHKLADKAIDNARSDLTTKLAQKKAALKAMKSELDKLEKKCTAEVLKKRDEIDKENELLRGLHDEFDNRDASWGDALRSYREADRSWQWWGRLEKTRYYWKRNCEWNLNHCAWYDKAYWVAKLTEATLGLEEAHARKAIDAELRHAGKAIMDLPAFRSIEVAINEAARKIDQFGRALDGLVNRGLAAWIEEMLKDEREDLNRQIRLLEALVRKSEELEAAYEQAKKDLDKTEERLSPKQEAARKRIAEIEGEIKMLPAQHEYMNKKKDYENMEIQVNHLIATLDDIKRVMGEVSQISKDVLNTLKKGIPRVTE
ncbi:hypothetical protein AU210_013764 [Fusarium oxysporum f. sp. radicis-cucumerinum]|uniref:Uncharacterized protein n=1 Tax=Fusarium oxysporum f. sp. radicis-cucumerinum TaxID=327505 RepID=A0A2H3G0M5_FUSOX|nr:hypothetical protein AU210_013764 [Fusarium oxysporum f. sp. radicis-cucumerinum]